MAENNAEITTHGGKVGSENNLEYLDHAHRYTSKIVDISVDPNDVVSKEALARVRSILREAQKKETNNAPEIAEAIDAAKAAKDPRIYEAVEKALGPELYKVKMEEQPLLQTLAGESRGLFKRIGGRMKDFFNRIRAPKASEKVIIPGPDGISKFAAEAMNTSNSSNFRETAQQTAEDALQRRNLARQGNNGKNSIDTTNGKEQQAT